MMHPPVLAWLRLYRVALKIDRKQNEHLRRWGLSTAQFDVLAHVGAAQGITQQELADHLLVTKGNISQLLDRMEQIGLLRRCQDKRSKTLVLTEVGQGLYNRVVPAQEQFITEQLGALSASEVSDLLRLLRRLDHAID